MINMKKTLLFTIGLFLSGLLSAQESTEMDLSGLWRFQTDPMGFGKTPGSELYQMKLSENIYLPGTMDQGGKGLKTTARYVDRLTRKFEYAGPAWYQREVVIPENWKNKEIILCLERCHWETSIYIDGNYVAEDERLSTPNRFVITKQLLPGIHNLTICVDNRLKYPMDQWNHGTTEYTQTNWNGIVGDIKLIAKDKIYLSPVKVYPNTDTKKLKVKIALSNPENRVITGNLSLIVKDKAGNKVADRNTSVSVSKDLFEFTEELDLGKKIDLWDEFNPNLYELETTFSTDSIKDAQTVSFGMRKVEQGAHHIRLNGQNIHLRGALDCAVFPLTGHPSTNVKDWLKIFGTVKAYGMNHVRFHSWCPPKAAFIAADEIGLYLQAELPMWIKDVGKYPARRDFFEKEMYALLNEYGNHPSFILMCNGNENEGNFDVLEDLVKKAQAFDNRRLYSASTARTHTKADQYYVSHVTGKGGITVYEGVPSTMWDKRKESDIDVPVIAHESGQRCMYPNFEEMKKYTGVLEPRNFEVFRERLAMNGMLNQADDFFRATGAHTVLQYKEVNEALLRTPNSGGFQLLGLSDFPGQGSAFVGILDAFWESKGLVTPEKFRESCAPTVLLARIPKRAYQNSDTLSAGFEIYHYGNKPIMRETFNWQLLTDEGKVLKKGTFPVRNIQCASLDSIGNIRLPLTDITSPSCLTLQASIGDTLQNSWNIWVYPEHAKKEPQLNYLYATEWNNEVKTALEEGKNVLLIPQKANGRKTRFASHFWNPIMFNWNPLIVGTLILNKNGMFHSFPTNNYADWQWWDILNYSTALEMNSIKQITPIIQSIDTYEYNRKLGIAFEAKVSNGNLLVLCVDAENKINERPATRQLIHSAKEYVGSNTFNPEVQLQTYELDNLFSDIAIEKKESNNTAIKQLLNQ